MRNRLLAFSALTLATPALTACGESASGDGVGGVSASEAQALNEAAEMLDARTNAMADQPAGLNRAAVRSAVKPD